MSNFYEQFAPNSRFTEKGRTEKGRAEVVVPKSRVPQ